MNHRSLNTPRHCPSCKAVLSFNNFLSSATNPNQQWKCNCCNHILKRDMSIIAGTFIVYIFTVAMPTVFIFGLLERVYKPGNPAEVLLGTTKPIAMLIVIALIAGLAAFIVLVLYYIFRVIKLD